MEYYLKLILYFMAHLFHNSYFAIMLRWKKALIIIEAVDYFTIFCVYEW